MLNAQPMDDSSRHEREIPPFSRISFDANPYPNVLLDATGKLLSVNPTFLHLCSKSANEIIGIPFQDYLNSSELFDFNLFLAELSKGSSQACVDIEVLCGEMKMRLLATGYLVREEGSETHAIQIQLLDQGKKLETERHLKINYDLFKEASLQARIGIFEYEVEKKTLFWSRVTREIHEVPEKYQPEVDQAINFYAPGESKVKINAAVTGAMQYGTPYDLECEIITAKGNRKWVRTTGHAEIRNGVCERLLGTFQDIDEAKKWQRQILDEKERIQHVLDGTNAGKWEWNVQTGETIFDERWANLIGYSLLELMPTTIETWGKFVHPDDLPHAQKLLEAYFSGITEQYVAEFRMKHRKGHWIWILDKGKVLERTPDGLPLTMYGTHQDITEQHNRNESLRQLSKAIEQSPVSVVITDTKGTIQYVNPKFTQVTGYSVTEAIGQNPRILKSGELSDEQYKRMWETLTSGMPWMGEFHNKRKDGSLFWESAMVSPIKNDKGEITHYLAIKEDITEKRELEQRIVESEKNYRDLFENIPIGIGIFNDAGEVFFINKHLTEMIGYSKEEITSIKAWMELVYPDQNLRQQMYEQRQQMFDVYLENGLPTPPTRVSLFTKAGEFKDVEINFAKIKESIVAMYRDVTELVHINDRLTKQYKLLSEIAWTQSHVVRAPVARLMSLYDFLANKEFGLISEQELMAYMRSSLLELDGVIREVSNKASILDYLDKKVD